MMQARRPSNPPSRSYPSLAAITFLLGCCLLGVTRAYPQSQQPPELEQRIPLARGWNLISLQVRGPGTGGGFPLPQLEASLVQASPPNQTTAAVQLWAYEPGPGFTGRVPEQPDFPGNARLTAVLPGRGYWLNVNEPATLILRGPAWNGVIEIPAQQWALVGFPGVVPADGEMFELPSVFGSQFADVEELWTWDAGLRRFVGYQPAGRPPISDLVGVEPGKGYWVKLRRPFRAEAKPVTLLPPDVDVSPLADRTNDPDGEIPHGPEDQPFDLDGDGKLDSAVSQRTIVFDPGVNTQTLQIANRGTGLVSWTLVNPIPWLKNSVSSGVVGTETDSITLRADRAALLRTHRAPGRYTDRFTLYAGETNFTFTVVVVIPTAAGDYRGSATVTRVNGKDIPLGQVDLHLSLFDDEPVPPGASPGDYFHAVINREQALLFPQDAFLRGVFYAGNSFTLTTTFLTPAGDRNLPPYETFRHDHTPSLDIRFRDIDQDGNGRLDNLNPFPFAVGRQITLVGAREDDGLLTGSYIEAIKDAITNQVIYLEGSFTLNRESLQPSRRTAFVGRSEGESGTIGGTATLSYTNSLDVLNSVFVSEALVSINLNPATPTNFTYALISPGGKSFALAPTNGQWRAVGLAGNQGSGAWQLVVQWDGSTTERGRLLGWELNLIGFNYRSATVHLLRETPDGPAPLEGATLTLIGGNVPRTVERAPSTNTFLELTEDSYVLRADYPGYQSASLAFNLSNTNLDLGSLILRPFTGTVAEVRAEPFVGSAPLFVRHVPRIPRAQYEALGANVVGEWFLGNGLRHTNSIVADAPLELTYTNAGSYANVLVLSGSAGTLRLTNTVHANALIPNPDSTLTTIQPIALIGSLASTDVTGANNVTVQIVVSGVTNQIPNARSGIVWGESQRDVAGFDFIREGDNPDLEFFYQSPVRLRPGSAPLVIPQSLKDEYPGGDGYQTYSTIPPRRFRMEVTLGGFVFGPFEYPNRPWRNESAQVGNIVLQSGRIAP